MLDKAASSPASHIILQTQTLFFGCYDTQTAPDNRSLTVVKQIATLGRSQHLTKLVWDFQASFS